MNPAPRKKREHQRSWADAVKALEAEAARLERSAEYHEKVEKAGSFRRVIGWLLEQNPVRARKRRSSVPPVASSNGVGGVE